MKQLVDEKTHQWNYGLTKWLVDEMTGWWKNGLMKLWVDEMTGWWNDWSTKRSSTIKKMHLKYNLCHNKSQSNEKLKVGQYDIYFNEFVHLINATNILLQSSERLKCHQTCKGPLHGAATFATKVFFQKTFVVKVVKTTIFKHLLYLL